MIISKTRSESIELQLFRYLNIRSILPENELKYYKTLEKGYKGEQNFDVLLQNLQGEFILIYDLLLEVNKTVFQIDTLLLSSENIYLFEIKNYEGDYFIDTDNKWYSITKCEIKNPIHQLNRCETLLNRLLQNLMYTSSVVSKLIFINPNFYLYQAPLHSHVIFPTQIKRFLNHLNLQLKQSKLKEEHFKLAQKLLSYHLEESPYIRKPKYTYEHLKKGIVCKCCYSFDIYFNSRTLVCNQCGFRENVEAAVKRSVEEFRILFPEKKITTTAIHEWCKVIKSQKTIRKILSINYKSMNCTKGNYYLVDNKVDNNH